MKPEEEALGRRAMACAHWQWKAGLRAIKRQPRGHLIGVRFTETEIGAVPGAIPDLTDLGSLGCLLGLVREVWGDPHAHAEWNEEDGSWRVVTRERRRIGTAIHHSHGATEAEALVVALEAAP